MSIGTFLMPSKFFDSHLAHLSSEIVVRSVTGRRLGENPFFEMLKVLLNNAGFVSVILR